MMNVERFYWSIALAAIVAMAASAAWLATDFRAASDQHRAVILARAQTTLDALTAGIRSHGRMGRYRRDRLTYIFEELTRTPDILGVSLSGSDETPLATAGETKARVSLQGDSPRWTPGVLHLSRTVALDLGGHGGGYGRGRMAAGEEWEEMPPGPHYVAVALNTQAMEREIARDRFRWAVTQAVVVLMVLSGALAAAGWVRRRRLQSALLVAREQAAYQERLTRLGAGLAHETKNPLGIVRGQAQLIVDSVDEPDETGENGTRARIIVDEIDRAVGQIDAFLKLSRPQVLTLAPVALQALISSLATVLSDEVQQHGVELVIEVGDRVVMADEEQLRRALLNLVLNALQACAPGGRIEIAESSTADTINLCVRDTGCGIAPDDVPRVTEPYFSQFEGGCGLGLALVEQIAVAHGWALVIDSMPGAGTNVTLRGLACVEEACGE